MRKSILVVGIILALLFAVLACSEGPPKVEVNDPASVAQAFYYYAGKNDFEKASEYAEPGSELKEWILSLGKSVAEGSGIVKDRSTLVFKTIDKSGNRARVQISGTETLKLRDGNVSSAGVQTVVEMVKKDDTWYVAQASGF